MLCYCLKFLYSLIFVPGELGGCDHSPRYTPHEPEPAHPNNSTLILVVQYTPHEPEPAHPNNSTLILVVQHTPDEPAPAHPNNSTLILVVQYTPHEPEPAQPPPPSCLYPCLYSYTVLHNTHLQATPFISVFRLQKITCHFYLRIPITI